MGANPHKAVWWWVMAHSYCCVPVHKEGIRDVRDINRPKIMIPEVDKVILKYMLKKSYFLRF
jgi:hypothetical protein